MLNTVILPQINKIDSLRNKEIDLIKGFLVFIMILYHCASVAEKTTPELLWIRESVKFVTYAFIIITGFLCAWYYVPKLNVSPQKMVRRRLIVRGIKILLIFLVSNIILYAVGIFDRRKLSNIIGSFADLWNLFLFPNGDLIAFEILLPIGLFLLLASLILSANHTLSIALLFTLVTIYLGNYIGILSSVAFGGIGLFAGALFQSVKVKNYLRRYEDNTMFFLILLLICFCLLLIVQLLSVALPDHFYLTFMTISWFLSFFSLSKIINNKYLSDAFNFLGNYTLLGYISQMLIIRIIYILLLHLGIYGYAYYIINVFISTILLYSFLKFINFSINHSVVFNKTYRFIFQ